ncbi:hypothetical protein SynA1825c_01807 [Synechococcus sp. A18-25c]|uniref:hypothetical protein n=1 Tax=Synechococcus sp. A18-25c TaxID=1866938 RepID=UPI001862052E|nr:hypothetical protein [Synechococcus sp. A18-25c]QNJ20109.1 hypothetical protein SynA1825c_01807 [Synechococcus sp. A18-25c]
MKSFSTKESIEIKDGITTAYETSDSSKAVDLFVDSSEASTAQQINQSALDGVDLKVDPKEIANIDVNQESIIQEAAVGELLNPDSISELYATPDNHASHIRERAAGANGANGDPDWENMTDEEKEEFARKFVEDLYSGVDSGLLDPDEPPVSQKVLDAFDGKRGQESDESEGQNDPADQGGSNEPEPGTDDGTGNNDNNTESEDGEGGFWDWLKSLFGGDDDNGGDGAEGNGSGAEESSENPMNEHQGEGDSEGDTSLEEVDADINFGEEGQNGGSLERDLGGFEAGDPITNWGPDGKSGGAGNELSIGIGLDDPHTNWGGENNGEVYVESDLIEALGDINPEINGSNDINSQFVQSMTTVGDDFF